MVQTQSRAPKKLTVDDAIEALSKGVSFIEEAAYLSDEQQNDLGLIAKRLSRTIGMYRKPPQ